VIAVKAPAICHTGQFGGLCITFRKICRSDLFYRHAGLVDFVTMIKSAFLLAVPLALLAQTDSAQTEYEGPSILSRGGPASSIIRLPDISFRPYLGLNALYDTSLRGVTVDPNGRLRSSNEFGLQGTAGIYGRHKFRHSVIGLDYRGNYNHYPGNHFADSTDQMLTLEFDHQLTRRLSFGLTEAVGTYTRNYLYTSASGLIDPGALILPQNGLFDNRVIYGQTGGAMTYRASSRLSFNFGAAGFLTRYRSSSLFGLTGYSVTADAGYRLTRYTTLAMFYNFNHFEFTHSFGASDIHTAGLGISSRLSRSVEFSVQAGGARVESLFLSAVRLDPVIAAITGQTTGVQAIYDVRYVPTVRARLTKQMQRSRAEVSYGRSVNPGNGIFLTSRTEEATGSFSYQGLRHWSLSANVGYMKLGALAQGIGTYTGYTAGLGVSRDLAHGLYWVLRGDELHAATNNTIANRNATRVTLGLSWSPGEIPLTLW